jgi:oligoribonuclease (3'-5' exoribonuclease)
MSTLFFIDVETTGLYPVEQHRILELGITAVSEPDFVEIDSWSTAIHHDDGMKILATNAFVFEMHEASGLNTELRAMAKGEKPKVLPRQALLEALAFVNRHSANCERDERGTPEVFMCGANPGFDRDYLKSWMPDLAKRFHHRSIDVNTLFLLRRFLLGGPRAKFGTAHRTIADNRQALAGIHEFVQSFAAAVGEVHLGRIAELENQIRETQAYFASDRAVRDALACIPG